MNCVLYGSANWSRDFTPWQTVEWERSCDVTAMKWMYCRYAIRMIYSWSDPCICIYHPNDYTCHFTVALHEHHHVSYHRQHECLFMCICCLTTKDIPKLRIPSLSCWYPPMTGGYSPQRTGDAESASMSLRQYENIGRHTALTIVSRPNPKQWQMVRSFNLRMLILRWVTNISTRSTKLEWPI